MTDQWPEWWVQYEETAERLHEVGDYEAADDVRTLVDGLRQCEREHASALDALDAAREEAKHATECWDGWEARADAAEDERERLADALREIEDEDPTEWHMGQGWQCVEFIQRKATRALAGVSAGQEDLGGAERVTHGRHCPCSACAKEDWTRIAAPCGMHGSECPAVYAPIPASAADQKETE